MTNNFKRWSLLGLMVVAFGLRVWYSRVNPLLPQFSNADDGDYYLRALRFVTTGRYVDDAWLIRPPLHVWFFAFWIKLAVVLGQSATTSVRMIQFVQAAMGAGQVLIGYGLVTRLFRNPRAGLLFATFWAIWFPFIDLSTTLFSEPLYLFLFSLHLWFLVRYDDQGRLRDLVVAGLLLGLAALTRSPALYALVFAGPWLLMKAWRSQRTDGDQSWRGLLAPRLRATLRPLAVLSAATLLIVLPWTARNWITYQRFIPVDTLGPINLWLDLGETSERNIKIDRLRQLPQADRQAYASAQARAILREDPLRPLRPMWGTFRAIIKAQFVEDFFVKRSDFGRALRPVAWLGLLGDGLWLVWTVAGLIGLLHPATDRPLKWVMALWLLYSVLTVLIFHVEPRYLLSIWFLLGIYGSWTLAAWRPRWPLRSRPTSKPTPAAKTRTGWAVLQAPWLRQGLIALVVLAFFGLFLTYRNYPTLLARGWQREVAFRSGERAYAQQNYVAAESAFRQVLAIEPRYIDGQVALALALAAQERPAEGLSLLDPAASRISGLVTGVLLRATDDLANAAPLLGEMERLANLDVQQWAFKSLRPEPRTTLVLGTDLDLGYLHGFALSEQLGGQSYRWLAGEGELRLPLPKPLALGHSVRLDLAAPVALDRPLEIRINDGPVITLAVEPGWRSFHLPISPGAVGQSTVRVRLSAPTFTPLRRDPASNDPRTLSLMVHAVAVDQH